MPILLRSLVHICCRKACRLGPLCLRIFLRRHLLIQLNGRLRSLLIGLRGRVVLTRVCVSLLGRCRCQLRFYLLGCLASLRKSCSMCSVVRLLGVSSIPVGELCMGSLLLVQMLQLVLFCRYRLLGSICFRRFLGRT